MAGALLMIVMAATLSIAAWSAGGVHAPGTMGFLLLVGIAGIVQGPSAAALTGLGCGAISLFLLVAEKEGFLPISSVHPTPTSLWLVLIFVMGEFVTVQVIVSWVVRRAEEQALASGAAWDKVEAARLETAEKFAKVFRASPDAIAITDLQSGEIVEVNASYEKLTGYSRAELIGRTTTELGFYADSLERHRMVRALVTDGLLREHEFYAFNRKRERIPLTLSGELIELGGRTHMVSILHDITERKLAESRERQARDEFARKLIASQEAERRRIANELHDSLGQNLILIKSRAEMALELAGTAPDVRGPLQNLRDMAVQAITEVRQISHDLRPHQLDQLGLTRALEAMIDGVAKSSKLPIESRLDPVDDLFSPEAATHLYRMAQESLSNILKHAQARGARVGLERDIQDVRLWIEDDGRGFATAPAKAEPSNGGLGLSSIAERARILGGTLRIESTPGQGTRVEVVIPHPDRV